MTTATAEKTFESASEEVGLKQTTNFPPFVDLYGEVGNWLTIALSEQKEITYKAKKGKQKGKMVTKEVYTGQVIETNIPGVSEDSMVTVSPAGLLAHQLDKQRPKNLKFPFRVGIKYTGKDDEGRNQTIVSWPKA